MSNDKQLEATSNLSGTFREVSWFFLLNLAWVLLAVFAVALGWRSYKLTFEGAVATGTVVRLIEDDLAAFTSDIKPVVEYEVNGETYSTTSANFYPWWDRYLRFSVGKQVEVRYEKGAPTNAEINSWLDIWFEPILLGLFSVVAAIGVNIYLVYRRRMRRGSMTAA